MKKLLIAIMFLSIILVINAKMIDQKTAEEVVENWIKQQDTRFEFSDQIVKVETQRVSEIVLTYTMHLKGQGFVIVSADDNIEPILAFSAKTKFDESNMAPATRDYLKGYYDQIELIISKELINKEAQNKWSSLINNTYQNRDTDYRNYLLSTTWNQGIYYNAQCPSDTQGPDGHVYAGCVATAMSQIMKYWAHPAQGQGTHSYYWSPYGTISANFGNATYNWVAMPNNITGHNTEIAKLLFHAGVSVDMQYGPNGSGAYSSDVPLALTSHFGYNSQAMKSKSSYADTQWTTMLKSELDNNRPILYAGYGPDGGHAFVCDGYSGTNYFHFNWGWSGSADGYFYLNALNPGSYSFTSDQMAIMGIEPVENDDPNDPNIVIIGNSASTTSSYDYPINFYYKSSLTQTIYLSNEINREGTIESIKFNAILNGDISGSKPITVWLANTSNSSFSSSNTWVPLNEFTQVFDGNINFDSFSGTKSITIQFDNPFNYNGGNLCVMVQRPLDTDWYNSSNKWKTTSVSSARTIFARTDSNNLTPQNYPTGTTASYISNTSLVFASGDPSVLPPTNVVATPYSNRVDLTWNAPANDTWFSHTTQETSQNAIGTGAAAQFVVAHRYSPAQLANFGVAGAALSKVQFLPRVSNAAYTVKIYTGGSAYNPGNLIHSQTATSVVTDVWNEVVLSTPVTIPTAMELWIAIDINTPTGHPAGCDNGPQVEGFGNMICFNGVWDTLTGLNPELTYNWMIKGFATGATGQASFTLYEEDNFAPKNSTITKKNTTPTHLSMVQANMSYSNSTINNAGNNNKFIQSQLDRAPTGYSIWRAPLATITNESTWTTIANNISSTNYSDNT